MPSSTLSAEASWERPAITKGHSAASLVITVNTAPAPHANRAPVDVAFALDRSGSMTGDKLALVKQAVRQASEHFSPDDTVALVMFDDEVEVLAGAGRASSSHLRDLADAVDRIEAGGSTNLCGGWLTASQQIAGGASLFNMPGIGPERQLKRTILLTDGLANVGTTSVSRLVKHASELRNLGITTSTLGVGDHFDEFLLSSIAEAGGGNFQFIATPRQLPEFFKREMGDLISTAVANLVLTLTFPDGLHGRILSGLPVKRRARTISVAIGHMPANDVVQIVVDAERQSGYRESSYQIEALLTWSNPTSAEPNAQRLVIAPLESVPPKIYDTIEINDAVSEQVALQRASQIQRDAMRLDREGRFRESREHHRQAFAYLQAAPESDLVSARREEARIFTEFTPDRAYDEGVRKQAIHNSYRRTRGRRDDR